MSNAAWERLVNSEEPVMIFGAGEAGFSAYSLLMNREGVAERLIAFIDSNPAKQGGTFRGLPVHAPDAKILTEMKPLAILCARGNQGIEQMRAVCGRLGLPCIDNRELRGKSGMRASFDLSQPPYSRPYPNTPLYVDIVNKCNLRCAHCPGLQELTKSEPFQRMSETLFRRIVDRAADLGMRLIKLFFRSEPFLHEDIAEFAAYAAGKKMQVSISTNLSMRSIPALIPALAHCDRLSVSVSGFTQEMHGRNHRGSDIDVVKSHLEEISREKSRGNAQRARVGIRYLNFGYNDSEVELFREYAHSLGFGFANAFGALVDAADGRDPDGEDERIFAASIRDYRDLRRNSLFARCAYRDESVALDHNADVYLCCLKWAGETARIGNFLTDDFADLQLLRQTNPYCAVCGLEMRGRHSADAP